VQRRWWDEIATVDVRPEPLRLQIMDSFHNDRYASSFVRLPHELIGAALLDGI
jgi:hypothetical protein